MVELAIGQVWALNYSLFGRFIRTVKIVEITEHDAIAVFSMDGVQFGTDPFEVPLKMFEAGDSVLIRQ